MNWIIRPSFNIGIDLQPFCATTYGCSGTTVFTCTSQAPGACPRLNCEGSSYTCPCVSGTVDTTE